MPIVKVNGININYEVEGQGEPLVMIMGVAATRIAWIFQTAAFKKRYQVVTFDNRGVGASDKPPGDYTIRMMADDTVGLMDNLGIDKAHILGVSMGGMIAQEIAINYPKRVLKLVLSCTFARRDEYGGLAPEFPEALGLTGRYTEDDIRKVSMVRLIIALTRLAFNNPVLSATINALMQAQVIRTGTAGLLGQAEAILKHDTADRLRLVNTPTLVITGTKDRIINPGSSEVIAKLIPHASLVKVEGGSHAFFVEMEGRFNREILKFLKSTC